MTLEEAFDLAMHAQSDIDRLVSSRELAKVAFTLGTGNPAHSCDDRDICMRWLEARRRDISNLEKR